MSMRAILFDYDGTLRDSVGELHRGVCAIFADLGVPEPTITDFHREFSIPSEWYYREHGIHLPMAELFERWYASCNVDMTELFADTRETLHTIHERGLAIALISGHRQEYIDRHTREHGISEYFDHIEGGLNDKAPSIRMFLDRVGIPYDQAAYVGDFVSDIRDAQEAGVLGVGITRETGSREALFAAGATHVVNDLTELLDWLFPFSQ